jgi:hypothetical protein
LRLCFDFHVGGVVVASDGNIAGDNDDDDHMCRGIIPLIDWMAEPSFMNSAVIKLVRAQLDAGDAWHVTPSFAFS